MLLSELVADIEKGMSWARTRTEDPVIAFAVGSVMGGWEAFSGVQLGDDDGRSVAVMSTGRGYYGETGVSAKDFRLQVEEFLAQHGDMSVVLEMHGEFVNRIDIVVDQDTDRDGNPIGLIMILQGYFVRASARP